MLPSPILPVGSTLPVAPSSSVGPVPVRRVHVRPPQSTPAQRKVLRAHVSASCERRPGIYRMLGANGATIYVGQSRVLRTRLLSYFRAGRGDKAARILRHTFAIEWEYTATEFGALLRELRLIKHFRPAFNSMLVTDEWPRGYVAVTGGAVPGLRVVRASDDPAATAMFGPFRRVAMLRDAVRALADTMTLRDCALDAPHDVVAGEVAPTVRTRALWFAREEREEREGSEDRRRSVAEDTRALQQSPPLTKRVRTAKRVLPVRTRTPGCLRHELGICAGPCIGEGDPTAYRKAVEDTRAFLAGKSDAPVRRLERAMLAASRALEFERAAVLRDRLARIGWLHERVRAFHADVDRLTFRYHARGSDGIEHVYLVRRGTVRAEVRAPSTPAEHDALERLAQRVFDGPDPTGADVPMHDLDEFYLVASWFRRRPAETKRTVRAIAERRV